MVHPFQARALLADGLQKDERKVFHREVEEVTERAAKIKRLLGLK